MLGRLTAQELTLWQAYYRMDPWGGARGDYHAAIVACTVANAMRGKGPPAKLDEFLLKFGEGQEKRQTAAQMAAALNAHAARSRKAR